MDLILVRHGHPDWTPDRIARNDPYLTALGQEQANRVARRLGASEHVDELWASPMSRALQTSAPVSSEVGIEPEVYEWLREIQNPPAWDGSPAEEIEKALRESNLRTMEEMWDGLPGGESFRAFHRRVVTGLDETLGAHGIRPMHAGHRHLWEVDDPEKRVVIVAHAGTNALVLGHLLGLEPVPWEWERFRQPHTGVSSHDGPHQHRVGLLSSSTRRREPPRGWDGHCMRESTIRTWAVGRPIFRIAVPDW